MRLRWDGFELDVPARRLAGPKGDVHVEPQVFDLLQLLIVERERVVSKEELLDTVWGDQFVSESALTTRIKDARRALGDDGRTQKFIRNAHGRGYQFVGTIEAATASPASSSEGPSPSELRLALDLTVDDEFPFVGRVAELEAAEVFVSPDRASSAQLFIGGTAGAGKSRLAIELLERAASSEQLVCAGRCEENVRSALQPVRDAFAQLASVRPERVASWCIGVEGPVLSLIPSLVTHLPQDAVQVDAYAGIDAFLTVFDRISADSPLAFLVDDLQWSDEPTRAFLDRLHRRLADRPISTVYTHRSGRGDLPSEVKRWIRGQARHHETRRIVLGDLDGSAAQELVAAVLGDEGEAAVALAKATAGNCLFLTESLRDMQLGEASSGSVAELVVARVARQSDDVQRLVRAGALLGHEFSFSTASRAADLDPSAALAAIDEAVDAELLHETASPARFRFSHQLVPEAIAAALGRRMRALVHSSCADALRDESGDEIEIAFHVLGSVPLISIAEAAQVGRQAAGMAVEMNQFDRAIRLLERVLEAGVETRTRGDVLLEIGAAIVARGTCGEAVAVFEEAAELGRRNGWPDVLADAALGHWGRSPYRRLSDGSTLALLREADEALGPEPSLRKGRVLAKTAAFSMFGSRLADRAKMTTAALEMAPGAVGIDRMELLESRAVVFSCPAGVDELDRIDPELEELRRAHSTYFADAAAPESRLLMRGLGAELREVAAVDQERTRAQPITEWRDAVLRSTLAAFAGDFDEARRCCDEGGAIGEPYWGESSYALHAMGLLFIDSLAGEWTRAADALGFVVDASEAQVLLPPLAWALCAAGDRDGALEVIGRLRPANLAWFGEHILGGSALVSYGELALLLDDDDMASKAERRLDPFRDLVLGVPWACSFAGADTLSRLAGRRGDEEVAKQYRSRAHALYTSLDAPALLARVD